MKNNQVNINCYGNTEVLKKLLSTPPKTLSYSEDNVRTIAKCAKVGASIDNVCGVFQKKPVTIRRWLDKYYQRHGNAENIWKLLKNNPGVNPVDANSTNTTETMRDKAERKVDFVLDSQLIQRFDGRITFDPLVQKLKSMGVRFMVHSKFRIDQFMTGKWNKDVKSWQEESKRIHNLKSLTRCI